LVGGIAILLAVKGVFGIFEVEWYLARSWLTSALLLGLFAALGVRREIDPAASERFRELADPSRPLHPDEVELSDPTRPIDAEAMISGPPRPLVSADPGMPRAESAPAGSRGPSRPRRPPDRS